MRYPKTILSILATVSVTALMTSTAVAQETVAVGYDEFAPGRFIATVTGVIALACAVFATVNLLRRSTMPERRRRLATIIRWVALVLVTYAVVHLFIFNGDFGTGNGRAGAIITIVLGAVTALLATATLKRRSVTK